MLPRVIIHNTVSLDGRMDWITPDLEIYYELAMRWNEDATLVGCDTLLNPPEEIPPETEKAFEQPKVVPGDTRPLLVVPDSRGRFRGWHFMKIQPYWRGMVALCSKSTSKEYLEYLEKRYVEYLIIGKDRVNLRAALEELNARYRIEVVRVDSGGTLNGILLREGLVNEVSVLINPSLVGGTTPRNLFRAPDLTSKEGVIQLKLIHLEKMKNDMVWLRYEVV